MSLFSYSIPLARCKIQCQVEESGYDRALATADFSQPVAGDAGTRYEATYLSWQAVFHRSRDQWKANTIAYGYCVIFNMARVPKKKQLSQKWRDRGFQNLAP